MKKTTIFWHRRDLRTDDNHGLYEALKNEGSVLPIFIFDTEILDELEDKKDARIEFIHEHLKEIKTFYQKHNSSLLVLHGKPKDVFKKLTEDYDIKSVYTNRDYEPYAQKRDREIYDLLKEKDIEFKGYKDHVVLEKGEVLKDDGDPYVVFTPYSRKWREKFNLDELPNYKIDDLTPNLFTTDSFEMPSLEDLGFEKTDVDFPEIDLSKSTLENYAEDRDIPAVKGTSRLSVHLRFGTISIREAIRRSIKKSDTFVTELIWREFYQMIIYHFPKSATSSFKSKYDKIEWRNNEKEFEAWCEGKTGYPIVDAGMRQLNETGYMHNRVRMIVASFLTKHLLIDWRWGEAYFAQKLLDYELASNVGGWQWASGSGCDAAPYFRIFNPYTQTKKFDPQRKYINKWVPEVDSEDYPEPIVDHKEGRERALATYKSALS
jgi:deoxyribodipyrimidine photo-lyase